MKTKGKEDKLWHNVNEQQNCCDQNRIHVNITICVVP